MKIHKNKKKIFILIILGIITIFAGCGKDESVPVNYQDEYLFTGGIEVGMNLKEAQKATRYSGWFSEKLDNYSRSVRRAKVDSAEFTYDNLPLSGKYSITPRITFDDSGEVIMIGMNLILNGITDETDFQRAHESYSKDFVKKYNLQETENTESEKMSVKQIGEKSVFRTATKLFYDTDVVNCDYFFDKSSKTGYAVLKIVNTEAEIPKYELAFLQFKY